MHVFILSFGMKAWALVFNDWTLPMGKEKKLKLKKDWTTIKYDLAQKNSKVFSAIFR